MPGLLVVGGRAHLVGGRALLVGGRVLLGVVAGDEWSVVALRCRGISSLAVGA